MSKGERDRAARPWVTGTSGTAYRQQEYLAEETVETVNCQHRNIQEKVQICERGKKEVVMNCS